MPCCWPGSLKCPPACSPSCHYMMQHNWLLTYAETEGIGRALQGLSRRASPGSGMETAATELRANYAAYAGRFSGILSGAAAVCSRHAGLKQHAGAKKPVLLCAAGRAFC